jgi:hypothetical protein
MKVYIVYDPCGEEKGYIRARNHNAAQIKAVQLYGENSHAVYTEI